MTINKGKFLRTVGWTTVIVGLYLVGVSLVHDDGVVFEVPIVPNDDVIDAVFTVVEE